jgi:hypothetical protein
MIFQQGICYSEDEVMIYADNGDQDEAKEAEAEKAYSSGNHGGCGIAGAGISSDVPVF